MLIKLLNHSNAYISLRGDCKFETRASVTKLYAASGSVLDTSALDAKLNFQILSLLEKSTQIRNFASAICAHKSSTEYARAIDIIDTLFNKRFVQIEIKDQDKIICNVVSTGPGKRQPTRPRCDLTKIKMSRFSYFREAEDCLVVENPISNIGVHVESYKFAANLLKFFFNRGAEGTNRMRYDSVGEKLALSTMFDAGILVEADPTDDEIAFGSMWEFHDLLFHSRTRVGGALSAYGGSYRFEGLIPPPQLKECDGVNCIRLPEPHSHKLDGGSLEFTKILQARQSIRGRTGNKITLSQLSLFLNLSARDSSRWINERGMTLVKRPYAAGGALGELGLTLVVFEPGELKEGVYRYHSDCHGLERHGPINETAIELGTYSACCCQVKELPQILMVISSRFDVVMYKYESVAYSTILKNVGCLIQSLYLAASACDIACCANGGGNSDDYCRLTGDSYLIESSVGEFALWGSLS